MKDANRIWVLMGKKLSLSITNAEEQELELMLISNPELWYTYELLQAAMSLDDIPEEYIQEFKSLLENQAGPDVLNDRMLGRLNPESKQVPKPSASVYAKYAVYTFTAVCTVLLIWFGFPKSVARKNELTAMNEIVAPKGSKTQITLADGTRIWLNAGSQLLYPKNFSLENREVYLKGEAYFEVKHHDKYAFVVHTAEADIRDLGTTFNARAYGGNSATEATLIEGVLEVTLKYNATQKILMQPKQKLVLHHRRKDGDADRQSEQVFELAKLVPFSETNDIVETAWVNDKLIFRDERFDDLAREMERRYNVKIDILDPKVKDYQLTGIFKNERVEEALKLLQSITPFKFKIKDEKIIISK